MIVIHPIEETDAEPPLIVVAPLADDARFPPGESYHEQPCQICLRTTLIDGNSLTLIRRRGVGIACLACAVERWPGLTVGTHAGDGHVVTLAEVAALRDAAPKEDPA